MHALPDKWGCRQKCVANQNKQSVLLGDRLSNLFTIMVKSNNGDLNYLRFP